jgi:broad specificity phosphatase PhoE
VWSRVAAALAEIADVDDQTLVVTHAGPIRCALAITHDIDINDAFAIPIAFGSWRSL